MRCRMVLLCAAVYVLIGLAGCGGGGGEMAPAPSPPGGASPEPSTEVGPFVIHTAATPDLQLQSIPSPSSAAFVAIHGAALDYVATQEILDQIVFCHNDDIYTCDLFGGNLQQLTDTNNEESFPQWSPDGAQIAYCSGYGSGSDIAVMDSDGSSGTELTDNSSMDCYPTWSPEGRRLAFATDRDGNMEIYTMYSDGSSQVNISNAPTSNESHPAWAPDAEELLVASDQCEENAPEIYRLYCDSGGLNQLTDMADAAVHPCFHPEGFMFSFSTRDPENGAAKEVYTALPNGTNVRPFSAHSAHDLLSAWSTCGRFIAFLSDRDGSDGIWLQEVEKPSRTYRVADTELGAQFGAGLHLGNPTLQTSRVLIGPSGSDRGFDPPITPSVAYGAVMAFNDEGYLNFARIGVYSHHADQLEVTPQEDAGTSVVALRITAPQLVNVVQDSGPGESANHWDLSGDTTAALLMFDADSGKLASVLALEDTALTASAGTQTGPAFRETGSGAAVTGAFSAVYDSTGELVAEGDIGSVEVDVEAGTTRAL